VLPLVAHWGDVTVHTLPPRHIPDDSAAAFDSATFLATPSKSAKKKKDDDDDEDDDSYDSDDDEEDVLQDFKLTALVSMLTGTRKIAVALTPAAAAAASSSAAGMEAGVGTLHVLVQSKQQLMTAGMWSM
jgi:hypothetical protein